MTDLPKAKRGVKLVQALSGPAKEAVQSLTVSDLIAEDGLKKVTKALKDAFAPYQETALPRAMESAIFGAARSHKESLPEYIVRFQQAQATLRSEGVDLPNKAAGYLLYRQANLDRDSEAKLTTWLQGDFSLDAVLLNLRKLDRVSAESLKARKARSLESKSQSKTRRTNGQRMATTTSRSGTRPRTASNRTRTTSSTRRTWWTCSPATRTFGRP